MAAEPVSPVTEEELRQICLEAALRGESVDYILRDYLRFGFEHEQQEADRAARHGAAEDDVAWWVTPARSSPQGRHRAAS